MERTTILHEHAQRRRVSKLKLIIRGACIGFEGAAKKSGFRVRPAFCTATYAKDGQWEPNHISELMRHYKNWCKRRGVEFRCVWVAELTKRGRVHYHWVMYLPYGITPPKPDKQGWWKHGSTNVGWARKPANYLTKYASKGMQTDHQFPKGCRLYGVRGKAGFLGWFRAPQWLRNLSKPGQNIVKIKGWWCNRSEGWGYRSPWIFDKVSALGVEIRYVGWTSDDCCLLENGLPPPD